MKHIHNASKLLTLTLVFGAFAACAGMGGYPAPEPRQPAPAPGSGYDETVVGEVVEVDARREEIEVRPDRGGQNVFVIYDRQTPVWYEGERYAVANLEPGDYIEARVRSDRGGGYVTDEIRVRESRQDRYGEGSVPSRDDRYDPRDDRYDDRYGDKADQLSGYVERVDPRRGTFELRIRRGEFLTIEMPYRPAARDRDVFERLRKGDHVRIRATPLRDDRYQLVEFEGRD